MGWGAALAVSSVGVISLVLFAAGAGKWISILIGLMRGN